MKIDWYAANGDKKAAKDLPEGLLVERVHQGLMHRAVVLRLANARQPIAHVKTRGEVKFSTRKLFRQKGTGNARRGSRGANLLRSGGFVFGPRNNANYSKSLSKGERRVALFSALTEVAQGKKLFGWDGLSLETPKTKAFVEVLAKLPEAKKYLFVIPEKNRALEKSLANVPGVEVILANYLNPYDILNAHQVCLVGEALEVVKSTFLSAKK